MLFACGRLDENAKFILSLDESLCSEFEMLLMIATYVSMLLVDVMMHNVMFYISYIFYNKLVDNLDMSKSRILCET